MQYIKNAEFSPKTIHYVFKKLELFSSMDRIMFQDLMQVLNGYSSSINKLINDEFHYNSPFNFETVTVAINALKKLEPSDEEKYIKSVFIKAGVNKLVDDSENVTTIINNNPISCYLYDAIAEKDFGKISDILNDSSTSNIILLYLYMFIDAKDKVGETLKKIVRSDNFIEDIFLLQNNFHLMSEEYPYPIHLITVLSEEEKKYISTICDFTDNFNAIFFELSTEIIKIQKKYSPYSKHIISESGMQNAHYKNIATQIININKYFIYNGLYTFGCYRFTNTFSGLVELLELYVDNLFFFQSPSCNHTKYESFCITKDDLIIISSYIKPEDLLLMINKYGIKKIALTTECIDYSLRNVIIEQLRRSVDNNQASFYLSQVALTICELLKLCELSTDNEENFVEMASMVLSVTLLHNDDYSYVVLRELYNELLESSIQYSWTTYNEKKIHCLFNALLSIIQSFNTENHVQQYIYKKYIEYYRTIFNICKVLSKHNFIIDDSLIYEFISICYKYYKDGLIDIYAICSEKNKALIKNEIKHNLDEYTALNIYLAMEQKIIKYDEIVEKHLINLCEKHIGKQKIDVQKLL